VVAEETILDGGSALSLTVSIGVAGVAAADGVEVGLVQADLPSTTSTPGSGRSRTSSTCRSPRSRSPPSSSAGSTPHRVDRALVVAVVGVAR
jgi:hypothetical protein